jgi:hypothetical protein
VSNFTTHHDVFGEGNRKGRGGITGLTFGSNANTEKASIDAEYHGSNGLVSDWIPPEVTDIDVFARLVLIEDKSARQLIVFGILSGDNFPSTEAFITDKSGTSVFLGIGFYDTLGAPTALAPQNALPGVNKRPITSFGVIFNLDDSGNFVSVTGGHFGRTYSISEWNRRFEACDAHDRNSCS